MRDNWMPIRQRQRELRRTGHMVSYDLHVTHTAISGARVLV